MKLKLAKWCSIIPLFFHALLIASTELYSAFLGNTTILCLSGLLVVLPSIYLMPFLAVLGFVLSVILIFQKERKAIKFLVLSFVNIIISVLLNLEFWQIYYSYKDELF